ncbi:MAG: peptidoglycan DD-metalloendopeptidase family protein [Peptococcaceae bacterium]|nr:peptidoglycan DD-metalloendopeptidase family protein [Peptococcaceae bacterium]
MEIANKQRDYDGRMAIFNLRLKEMYQYGEVNFLEVLLQSSSLSDFLTRFEYLKYIANNDKKLLDEVTAMKSTLEDQKKSLDSMKVSLEANKKTQLEKSAELAAATQAQQQLVNQINSDLNAQFEILEDLEAESKAIASQIKAIQAKNSSNNTSAPGAYVWPCPSSRLITSEYGYRIHPIQGTKKMHTGIDIGAKSGTDIVAAAGGTVIMAQYYGGYGNCVIVDHGGGVSTLYAHMSKIGVSNGQKVSAGQSIGKVGSTGNSTGPHLHFEVRINGNTQNPRNYV